MADAVRELLVTDTAATKLGARGISDDDVVQLLRNVNVRVRNPKAAEEPARALLIGRTDGGAVLTVVVEQTIEPSTWLVITGWTATEVERKMLRH